jgi:hypothetical protein
LPLALVVDDAAGRDRKLSRITTSSSGVACARSFAHTALARCEDPACVQVRAGLWAELSTQDVVRARFAEATQRHRALVHSAWANRVRVRESRR